MKSQRPLTGKVYPRVAWAANPSCLRQFAAATGDVEVAGGGAISVVPPLAVALASTGGGAMQIVADALSHNGVAPSTAVLHAAEDIAWRRALRPNEVLYVTARLAAIDSLDAGDILHVLTTLSTGARGIGDTWVVRRQSVLFVRALRLGAPDARLAPWAKATRAATDWQRQAARSVPAAGLTHATANAVHSQSWLVLPDQARRYAAVSGDDNPLHTDEAAAVRAGFKGCILHGLCTMAFAQRAVVQGFAPGDTARLRRLAVQFTRPVYLNDQLCFEGSSSPDGNVTFAVRNQHGRIVLGNGVAQLGHERF